MPQIALEVVFILLLILANGAFALAEISLVSARSARLQPAADHGDRRARAALALKSNPDQFLATVQVGITLIGILTGAFSGATLTGVLAESLRQVPWLARYANTAALLLVVLTITYFSLLLGELVPKRLGLNAPEQAALRVALPMQWLARLAAPMVAILSFSTSVLTRLLGARPSTEPAVTQEEVRVMLQQGADSGVFEEAEHEMVEAVFRLADRRVGALVTPRPEMVWLDVDATQEQLRDLLRAHPFSRMPVCQGSPDRVVGIASLRSLILQVLDGQALDLAAAMTPPLFVPENSRAVHLLERLRETGERMAIVVDEHGGTHGLVTMTDLAESVLGDLPDQEARGESEITRREDGSWLIDGLVPLDELGELGEFVPGGEGYTTLGGFVVTTLGRIPASGESFEHAGLRFEVMDMDGLRVDKVLVSRVE